MIPAVMICSGKGGVGKTLITVNLSLALSASHKVGIIDLDILNPNLTYAMGITDKRSELYNNSLVMKPYQYRENIEIISPSHYFYDSDGHREISLTEQGMSDFVRMALRFTTWQSDMWVIDTDPSSKQIIPIMSSILGHRLYAVMVMENSIPSIADAERMYDKLYKRAIHVLGVIHNRSFGESDLVDRFAQAHGVKVIATIPFDEEIAKRISRGNAILPDRYSNIMKDTGDMIWRIVHS
jgi:MinD superfamily P-loop ATPase